MMTFEFLKISITKIIYNILTESPLSKLETEKIIPDDKDGVVQTTQDPQIIDNSNSTVKISAHPISPTKNKSSSTSLMEKVTQNKSSFMEKVSQRASTLNLTRLTSELVLATGSSTLR